MPRGTHRRATGAPAGVGQADRPARLQPDGRRDGKAAGIPRHISPHSLRHAAITNALDAGVPLRDAQILARHADPRTTEYYDRARGNLDRHRVHFLTAYVAGV
jgi:integrase